MTALERLRYRLDTKFGEAYTELIQRMVDEAIKAKHQQRSESTTQAIARLRSRHQQLSETIDFIERQEDGTPPSKP